MDEVRVPIPPKEFEREYMTQWRKEVEFLKSKGIEYTFAKRVGEYRIVSYKYKKTVQLFLALAEFYNQQQFRRNIEQIDKTTELIEKQEDNKGFSRVVTNDELIEKLNNVPETSAVPQQEIQSAIERLQDDTE